MKSFMRTTLIGVMLLISGPAFGTDISIGINIGAPPPPVVVAVPPPPPEPEVVWVPGYWYPVKKRYKWHEGYWTRLPYPGAVWMPPRYDGARFFVGYWRGDQGRLEHDHRWDRERDRDCHRGHNKGHHRGHDQDHDH
jgi:YXWGXW repeat-containing protein